MADTAEGAVGAVSALLGSGNKVLGFNGGPQTYLILLQNNMELRATGGFLGSYIALDFNQGKVTRFKVDDIYNPDGILKQKITAPAAAKKYMDVKELGIRDANWWPDFPTSAEKVATLYEFATHEKVAYVLAVNLEVIKSLLKATGPIELPAYQETITADNLFERTETQAEVGFKPGSTQKKEFLSGLANKLIDRLIKDQNIDRASLGQSSLSNLAQKNILIYSRDASLQKNLVQANWAGQVQTAAGDYLMAVDSNVGGNKANFWVSRALSYQVNVDRSGNLIANFQATWTHAGQSETWPGGKYRNFFRVYVPQGAALVKKQGFSGEVTAYEEFGKTIFGGLVEVPINAKKQIELKYKLPEAVGFAYSDKYRLLVQKQGGMKAEQFNFKLNLPPFLTLEQGKTELKQALKQDQLIKLTTKR